jgi:exopolysaccharide production protein ExoZ
LKTLSSIQYLRGLAALSVVAFHACQWSGVDFDVGAGGVDVFFVISGLVIWIVTQQRPQTSTAFLGRRLARIAPLYWAITLALAATAALAPAMIPALKLDGRGLLLSLAFVQHTDPAGQVFPVLPPGWSLNYEAAFYLIVASALSAAPRQRLTVTTVRLAALAVFGFLYHPAYELLANPTMLEFAAGCLLGDAYLKGRLPGRRVGWALLAAGLLAFVGQRVMGFHSDLWRPLMWGAPAAMIVGGGLSAEADGGVPRSRVLGVLGDASYSLYLCHWPVIAVMAAATIRPDPWLFAPAAMIGSVAVGLACRQAVEKPLLALLSRWDAPARPPRLPVELAT